MARLGKLILPNLDGVDFVPVHIEGINPPTPVPKANIDSGTLDIIKADVIVRLDAGTTAERIAEIAYAQ